MLPDVHELSLNNDYKNEESSKCQSEEKKNSRSQRC